MTTPTTPQLPAFIRTYVPLGVAALVGWLANLGVILPASASEGLALFLGPLAGALWYAGVRYLEAKWPALGVLLGSAKTPTYEPLAVIESPVLDIEAPAGYEVAVVSDAKTEVVDIIGQREGADPIAVGDEIVARLIAVGWRPTALPPARHLEGGLSYSFHDTGVPSSKSLDELAHDDTDD